jgi:hypothetical protein
MCVTACFTQKQKSVQDSLRDPDDSGDDLCENKNLTNIPTSNETENPNFTEGEPVQEIQAKIIFSQTNALGTF